MTSTVYTRATAAQNMTSAVVDLAAATANQAIVAAPGAGKQIWVYGLAFAIAAAGTIVLQDEDDTAISGIFDLAANGVVVLPPSGDVDMPWFKVPTNKALEADTVGAGATVDGIITYSIVTV